jgi:serine/threonine protein phosphatase 1
MERLFAISDIHGCFKPFHELIINTIKLTRSDNLILLGDYIDRGDQSKEVIDFIIYLREKGFNITALVGNHEAMLINSYYDNGMLPLWLMNGGMSTILSFGLNDIREIDDHYLEFFKSLEYYKIVQNFVFVHAGFDDTATDPFSDKQSMLWECRLSYNNPSLSEKTVIHGHRPKQISYIKKLIAARSKVIPVDTGCVYGKESGYGLLSALEVGKMTLYSVPCSQI